MLPKQLQAQQLNNPFTRGKHYPVVIFIDCWVVPVNLRMIKTCLLRVALILMGFCMANGAFAQAPASALNGYLSQELNKQIPDADVMVANPASRYCITHNGQLQIKTDANGSQYGICILRTNEIYEEWCLYRKELHQVNSCPNLIDQINEE
jgi:putative hemolysin